MLNKHIFGILVIALASVSFITAFYYDSQDNLNFSEFNEYQSVVIYRNDDVTEALSNEFNKTNDLFIQYKVPVTHAVIPSAIEGKKDTSEHCKALRKLKNDYPELIDYSLHGYSHDLVGEPPTEFDGRQKVVQEDKIREGIEFFQKCIGERPKSFVPPGNTYDDTTLEVLAEYNISLMSANVHYSDQDWSFGNKDIDHSRDVYVGGMTYMYVRDWDDNQLNPLESSLNGINDSLNKGNIHTQVLHYKSLSQYESPEQSNGFVHLEESLKYTSSHDNVKHVNLGSLSKLLDNKELTTSKKHDWRIKS